MKVLDNEMRRYILKVLSITENITFSKLFQNKFYSSSQFTYHLNWLVNGNFVEKTNGKYKLGKEGKKLMNYVELETVSVVKQPLIVVGVLLKKGNKILTSSSKKIPLKELWGLSCFAKMRFGENIKDSICNSCKRHLGYDVEEIKFKGIFHIKTKNPKLHHQLLVFTSDKFKGELKEETETRINKWVTLKQLNKLKQYPDNPFILEHLNNKFFELERDIDLDCLYSL